MIAWNVIAALASFASLLTWIVQYFVKLRESVLIREDKTKGGWTTSGKANIGHSFWLVVVAFAIFCLNVTILHFLRKRRNKSQNSKRAIVEATTKPNGNLMLYWAPSILALKAGYAHCVCLDILIVEIPCTINISNLWLIWMDPDVVLYLHNFLSTFFIQWQKCLKKIASFFHYYCWLSIAGQLYSIGP